MSPKHGLFLTKIICSVIKQENTENKEKLKPVITYDSEAITFNLFC